MRYFFRTCIVDIVAILVLIYVVNGEMTADVVYDALSSRLDTISFDIRLFRSDVSEAESRIGGIERNIEELSKKCQTRAEGTTTEIRQRDATIHIDSEIRRHAIIMQKMVVAEKKYLRNLEKQIRDELKDMIGQRINDMNISLEDVRGRVEDERVSVAKQLDGYKQKLDSINASVTKGHKGHDGEKGVIGPRGLPGVSMIGPPGPSGVSGPKGERGYRGSTGRQGPSGNKGSKGESTTSSKSLQHLVRFKFE